MKKPTTYTRTVSRSAKRPEASKMVVEDKTSASEAMALDISLDDPFQYSENVSLAAMSQKIHSF